MKYTILILLLTQVNCNDNNKAFDTLLINGTFFSAAEKSRDINALGIKDGKIAYVGYVEDFGDLKSKTDNVVDVSNCFIMPGFIEGHGHFSGLGKSMQNLNFLNDTSWTQIIQKVKAKIETSAPGEWIYGRGWHQEKWKDIPEQTVGGYPVHNTLSMLSPNNPVVLYHASGHSLFANKKAMSIAGISRETSDPRGGKIIRDSNGGAIGVFEEKAMKSISLTYQTYLASLSSEQQDSIWYNAINLAQKECIENGITSFQDAGSSFYELEKYEDLAKNGQLDIRLWAMARHKSEDLKNNVADFRKIGVGNNFYTCRAIKTEVDGALGAHGAWLTGPYEDKPEFYGQNTTEISEVKAIAEISEKNNMQLCVHAIGDRANKEVLDIIEEYQNKTSSPLRWRVEHAQHLNPTDIMRFKATGALASMQGIHCTSDAPFVVKRLGLLRSRIGAYPWKALLNQKVLIINGTDTPVEDIDPIKNFYASVTRKRIDNGMPFYVEQKMDRLQALKSYTIDAAYGAFEEEIKGSLEQGKVADIVILNKNLLECDDLEILDTKIIFTIVNGEIKYSSSD